MRDLIPARFGIAPMSEIALAKVSHLEAERMPLPQVPIPTDHKLHAGMYARTVCIPEGVLITGVLIKIATLLIVDGDCEVYVGDGWTRVSGYAVLPAAAGRKQAFVAHKPTLLTMIFPTDAKTVDEAERQFTDEIDKLATRREAPCQA